MNKLIKTNGCILTDRITDFDKDNRVMDIERYKDGQISFDILEPHYLIDGLMEIFHIVDTGFTSGGENEDIYYYGRLTLENGDVHEGLFRSDVWKHGGNGTDFIGTSFSGKYKNGDEGAFIPRILEREVSVLNLFDGSEHKVESIYFPRLVTGIVTYKDGYTESGDWEMSYRPNVTLEMSYRPNVTDVYERSHDDYFHMVTHTYGKEGETKVLNTHSNQ
jgi:hypothetical protein